MKIQLWRNATIQLEIGDSVFLIDPMLGKKGSFGPFPWTEDRRHNPLIDLPFPASHLPEKLEKINAVIVTHLHPDHWDQTAIELIDKDKLILCPDIIADQIRNFGFRNVQCIEQNNQYNDIQLSLTKGRHGEGEIEEKMGMVNGVVFTYKNQSVYIVGDSIWCNEVKLELEKHEPQYIVIAGGEATFFTGKHVTMNTADINELAHCAPEAKILITHLEAVSPCKQDRDEVNKFLEKNKLLFQCKVLADGESVELTNHESHAG